MQNFQSWDKPKLRTGLAKPTNHFVIIKLSIE